jgi:hypothetical protein
MAILTKTNINPVPVYSSTAEQVHRLPWGEYVPIYVPNNRLLPFQLICNTAVSSDITIKLYNKHDVFLQDVNVAECNTLIVPIATPSPYKVLVCAGGILTTELPNEDCYMVIQVGATGGVHEHFYFELMQPCTDTWLQNNCVSVEYWNTSATPYGSYQILQPANFRFQSYFLANLQVKYPSKEVAEERELRVFQIKYISDKLFTFGFWTTEAIMDAFRIAPSFDYIAINNRGKLHKPQQLLFSEIEFDKRGAKAWIECSFNTDSIFEKNGTAKPTRGDFNESYSESF